MKFVLSVSALSTFAYVALGGYICQDECMNVSNDMNYDYQPMQEAAPQENKPRRRRRMNKRFLAFCSNIEECKTGCLEQKDKSVCKTYRRKMRAARRKMRAARRIPRTAEQKAASKARFNAYCSAIDECKSGCLDNGDKSAASKARFNAYCSAIDECKSGCLDNGDKSVCRTYRKSFRKQNRKNRRASFRVKFNAFCTQIDECNSGCLVNKNRSVCRTYFKQFRHQNKKN
ncbi:hypothetical protein AYI69_g3853 [Smittium culicis]|uniref:Uncharacterized protein n=1 Tax=Smittium culicis TaxID=133412 RepID=A0A1R1YIL8_9FUNG|nr:hypothetical protein AYI69_g3853 [Smittium culicis]